MGRELEGHLEYDVLAHHLFSLARFTRVLKR
jgi:hypothetical protein